MKHRPRLLITLGDVAGIGPEIVAKAWVKLQSMCRPIVVGDDDWLRLALQMTGGRQKVVSVACIADAQPSPTQIPCLQGTRLDLSEVKQGQVSAVAGRAAYDFLCAAIDLTLAGEAAGIVTLPLHKEGLHAAGLDYPGHTEILAERTGVEQFAMMLYAPPGPHLQRALSVVHVTLHMPLRAIFPWLTVKAVHEKILLLHCCLSKLRPRKKPRLAVAALNPHAGDGGLFGHEEETLAYAVQQATNGGIDVVGPLPSDTLFVQAQQGKFDGIVAMYHDQGHIPMKLLTGLAAVNVTLGLPIVRTSVAHGTAYDIAGKGSADPQSLLEAVRVAAALTKR